MFERIVGPIVGAPAHDGLQIAAAVVIFLEEFRGGGNVGGEQLPLQERPARRFHARLHANGDVSGLGTESQAGDRHQQARAERLHFTEYFVNAPPAWRIEFGPSAAYTLPSESTAMPSPAVP